MNVSDQIALVPSQSAPLVKFKRQNGSDVAVRSGHELPFDLALDTQFFFPAHDYWPAIPGLLFIHTTYGDIRRAAFQVAHSLDNDRTQLNTLIRSVNEIAPLADELYRNSMSGDAAATEAYTNWNTDIMICTCAIHRRIHVVTSIPRPGIPAAMFTICN